MSNVNLHTCAKGSPLAQTKGPCEQCQRDENALKMMMELSTTTILCVHGRPEYDCLVCTSKTPPPEYRQLHKECATELLVVLKACDVATKRAEELEKLWKELLVAYNELSGQRADLSFMLHRIVGNRELPETAPLLLKEAKTLLESISKS